MKRRSGFTLLELVIAIFLFSFGILSVVQIFPLNRHLLTQSSMQTQASFLAQEQMEHVRSLSYADLTPGTFEARATLPTTMGQFAGRFERMTTVQLINGSYAVSATDVGLKRITVTVYWQERGGERNYRLTSYENNL
jgi:prepilin-type N-terminal cleavage/methylation domain-containing protein